MYDSDISAAKWLEISDLFDVGNYGNQRKHEKHVMLNAIFYLAESGCKWRQLPNDFPKWTAVYSFFRRYRDKGTWEKLNDRMVINDRILSGRLGEPSFGLLDSQSKATTSEFEVKGFDGGKKNKRD